MHLIRIDRDGADPLAQAVVSVAWPLSAATAGQAAAVAAFARLHRASVDAALAAPLVSAFVAVDVSPEAGLRTTYSFVGLWRDAAEMRLSAAALARLDGIAGAEARTPRSAQDFVETFAAIDAPRLVADHAPHPTSDGGVVRPHAALFIGLGEMLALAATLGVRFRFEAASIARQPDPEQIRAAQYDALRLERETAAPPELAADQRGFAQGLSAARRHVLEAVVIDADRAPALERALASASGAARFDLAPTLAPASEAESVALGYMTHPAVMDPARAPEELSLPMFLSADAAAERFRAAPLTRRLNAAPDAPEPGSASPLELALLRSGGGSGGAAAAAPAAPSDGGFLFVSYAHADRALVEPLVSRLGARGVATWMDASIIGGEEWDTRLETQIVGSTGLLAIVSDAYAASKYCRREAKFADILDKPIIAVRAGSGALGDGLDFLFATLQHVRLEDPELEDKLVAAVAAQAQAALRNGGAAS